MPARVRRRGRHLARAAVRAIRCRLARWLRPATASALALGTAVDLVRGKRELVAENALLRQQLIILARSTKRRGERRPRARRATPRRPAGGLTTADG